MEKASAERFFKAKQRENDLVNTELGLRRMLPFKEKEDLRWLYGPEYDAANHEIMNAQDDLTKGWGDDWMSINRRDPKLKELIHAANTEPSEAGLNDPRRMAINYFKRED